MSLLEQAWKYPGTAINQWGYFSNLLHLMNITVDKIKTGDSDIAYWGINQIYAWLQEAVDAVEKSLLSTVADAPALLRSWNSTAQNLATVGIYASTVSRDITAVDETTGAREISLTITEPETASQTIMSAPAVSTEGITTTPNPETQQNNGALLALIAVVALSMR